MSLYKLMWTHLTDVNVRTGSPVNLKHMFMSKLRNEFIFGIMTNVLFRYLVLI